MNKTLSGITAALFALGLGASAAMAATTPATSQPETFAALPKVVKTTVMKTWPQAYDMKPLVWKLSDGAYRVDVRTVTNKLKEIVVGPHGKIQKQG